MKVQLVSVLVWGLQLRLKNDNGKRFFPFVKRQKDSKLREQVKRGHKTCMVR